jgi:CubicO group peptidase (beta-lactamase class C family)
MTHSSNALLSHQTPMLSRRSVLAAACAAVPALMFSRAMAEPAVSTANSFVEADRAIENAVEQGLIPGAVLCAGRKAGDLYVKAYGSRAIEPERVTMTDDTVFDLASLTKPLATATSIMLLAERGKLSVTDRVAKYLPPFAANGKADVTIEQLLLHRGGVVADNPMSDFENVAPEAAMLKTLETQLRYEPGTKFVYSDVGFMTLGEVVRVVSGKPVNVFAREEIYVPLGMKETMYTPGDDLKPRCAPTEKRGGQWTPGVVHDPRAFALGLVAGHAGLFGTARDIARYCRMMLNNGELDGVRIFKDTTVAEMTKPRALPDGTGIRGYGFDIDTSYSSPRGERFAKGKSFGHTGFTGTSLWIDPVNDAFVVLLTNSVHPNGKGKTVALRREVGTAVGIALLGKDPAAAPEADKSQPASGGK